MTARKSKTDAPAEIGGEQYGKGVGEKGLAALELDANAIRPNDVLTLGDDMPVEQRIRLKCAEIAARASGHDSYASIRGLAAELEDFVVHGGAKRRD